MADSDKAEKSRLVLAERLRTLQAAGFLTFEDVVRHLRKSDTHATCIMKLAKFTGPDGFEKIYGDLYDSLPHDRAMMLNLWKKALVGEVPFAYMLCDVLRDELPRLFERWLTEPDRATWEQLVNASCYVVLRNCAAEGEKRADEAVAETEATVVEAEDIEEEVEVVPTGNAPAAKPADSDNPYDGRHDITDRPDGKRADSTRGPGIE